MVFRSGTRLYYGDSNPKKMGTSVYRKYTGELGEHVVYDYGSKKIYYYDMVTGENGVYIEDLGANMGQIYYADENVAVLYNFYYDYDFNDPDANTDDCYAYNIKKKVKSLIFGVTY